jgi:chemotaxis protein histidine kinase CheA
MKYSQSELEARLAEIRRSYLVSLQGKHAVLRKHWAELSQQWDDETYRELFMILHNLAGSAETFGLAEVSANARVLVELLRPLADAGSTANPASAVASMKADFERLISSLELAVSA